jgi:Mg2+-importing ATPase
LLGLTPLPATYFIWLAGFLVAYAVLTHSVKMWFGRRFGTD